MRYGSDAPPSSGKETGVSESWAEVMAPNIARLELAAKFNQSACWNAKGSAAMAKLLREMCRIIDVEIDKRTNLTTAKRKRG